MISYGKQNIDKDDIKAVTAILKSDWLTQGPVVKKFEKKLIKNFGSQYCSVVSNGTAALHLSGLALDWGTEDIVLTSPITFLATAGSTAPFVGLFGTVWGIMNSFQSIAIAQNTNLHCFDQKTTILKP